MTDDRQQIEDRAAELRDAFDRSFAVPPPPPAPPTEALLLVGAGDRTYAVRSPEIAGVAMDWALVPLPGTTPEFRGITVLKGIVPVYSLGALLGGSPGDRERSLLLVTGPVGLAFDRIVGRLQVVPDDLVAYDASEARPPFHQALVADGDGAVPVLDIPAIIVAITHLASGAGIR